jgi:FG-GAP-like repeat/FG-GAP repeat
MLKNVTFSMSISGVSGAYAQQLLVGDFNGDGIADLAVPFSYGNGTQPGPILFFTGDGHGGFVDATSALFSGQIPTAIYDARILGGDFNKDGRTDVIGLDFGQDASPFSGAQSELFLSAPAGKMTVATANLPQHVLTTHGGVVGDINGDGNLDAVLLNIAPTNHGLAMEILLGDGAGHFTEADQLAPASYQSQFNPGNTWGALVDVNGDGWVDFIAGTWSASPSLPSEIYLNNNGSFANSAPIPLPASGVSNQSVMQVQPLDLNGDGAPDLVLSVTNLDYTVGYLQFLVNDGGGHFHDETAARLPQSIQPSGRWIKFIQAIDVNGDGTTDLVTQWWGAGLGIVTKIYLNDGSGHFSPVSQTINGAATAIPNEDGHGHMAFAVVVGTQLQVIADDLLPVFPNTREIFWNDASGANLVWAVKPNEQIISGPNLPTVPTSWSVAGVGDFNNDGISDLLWRDASGANQIWNMQNFQLVSGATLPAPPSSWNVSGVGVNRVTSGLSTGLEGDPALSQMVQAMASFAPSGGNGAAGPIAQQPSDPNSQLFASNSLH